MKFTSIIFSTIVSATLAFQSPAVQMMTGFRNHELVLHAAPETNAEQGEAINRDFLSGFKHEKTRSQAIEQGAGIFVAALGLMGMDIAPADAKTDTLEGLNIFKDVAVGTRTNVVATFPKLGPKKATIIRTGGLEFKIITAEDFPSKFLSQTITFVQSSFPVVVVRNVAIFEGRTIKSSFRFVLNRDTGTLEKGSTRIPVNDGLIGTTNIDALNGKGPSTVDKA